MHPALPGFEEIIHSPKKRVPSESVQEDLVAVSNLEEVGRIHKGVDDVFGHLFDELGLLKSINTGYIGGGWRNES